MDEGAVLAILAYLATVILIRGPKPRSQQKPIPDSCLNLHTRHPYVIQLQTATVRLSSLPGDFRSLV